MQVKNTYHPENYWSEVAEKINLRKGHNVLAGDDSPFYRYKRQKFLKMLKSLKVSNKNIMELGAGPGGNIKELLDLNPKSITDADISAKMLTIASSHINDPRVKFQKINGEQLPFPDKIFDLVFSATVLQHNTNEKMMKSILSEMCRVSAENVVLFERTENKIKGNDLCKGRPASYYTKIANQNGFKLKEVTYINIRISYLVCGAIRNLLNPGGRREGEKQSRFSKILQKLSLPITKLLDQLFPSKKNMAKMIYVRES